VSAPAVVQPTTLLILSDMQKDWRKDQQHHLLTKTYRTKYLFLTINLPWMSKWKFIKNRILRNTSPMINLKRKKTHSQLWKRVWLRHPRISNQSRKKLLLSQEIVTWGRDHLRLKTCSTEQHSNNNNRSFSDYGQDEQTNIDNEYEGMILDDPTPHSNF